MKVKLYTLLIIAFFAFSLTNNLIAQTAITVINAGSTTANGYYTQSSDFNNKPSYQFASFTIRWDGTYWVFYSSTRRGVYYSNLSNTSLPPADGWVTVQGVGALSPAPTLSGNGTLPVELTSFSANISENNVLLNWQTATELNNYGFEVQKSKADSQDLVWEKIGFVQGHGNSNSQNEYSFGDNSAHTGKFLYRLKQIDIDGNFEYSDEIEVRVTYLPESFKLSQNYPNPFNPTTTIKYSVPSNEYVSLKVYDILGNEVATLVDAQKAAGSYQIKFSANSLSSGLYLYRIQAGNFKQIRKMLLTK